MNRFEFIRLLVRSTNNLNVSVYELMKAYDSYEDKKDININRFYMKAIKEAIKWELSVNIMNNVSFENVVSMYKECLVW